VSSSASSTANGTRSKFAAFRIFATTNAGRKPSTPNMMMAPRICPMGLIAGNPSGVVNQARPSRTGSAAGVAPQHEPGDYDPEEAGIPVHRHRADHVVDLEATLHPVVQVESDRCTRPGDQHGLQRVVEVIARRCRDDAGQASRECPERIPLAEQEGHQQAPGQREQEVEGDGRQGGGHQVDVGGGEEGLTVSANVEDRNGAGDVEAPETRVDKEQPDTPHPHVVRRDRGSP
jgi:hypothetical protein